MESWEKAAFGNFAVGSRGELVELNFFAVIPPYFGNGERGVGWKLAQGFVRDIDLDDDVLTRSSGPFFCAMASGRLQSRDTN